MADNPDRDLLEALRDYFRARRDYWQRCANYGDATPHHDSRAIEADQMARYMTSVIAEYQGFTGGHPDPVGRLDRLTEKLEAKRPPSQNNDRINNREEHEA